MLIEKVRAGFIPSVKITTLREWNNGGCEVGVYRLDNLPTSRLDHASAIMFTCACTSHACPARAAARAEVMNEVRAELAPLLSTQGLKAALLEIQRRATSLEYLGQECLSYVSINDAAALLDAPIEAIRLACDQLFEEEKLELVGGTLREFEQRFRLPRELAAIMANIAEEGSDRVAGFEHKVQEVTGITSGRVAFGEHYPNIDKRILGKFVCTWCFIRFARVHVTPASDFYSVQQLTAERILKDLRSTLPAPLNPRVFSMYLAELIEIAFENAVIEMQALPRSARPETFYRLARHFAELGRQFHGE